jgi:A/G-specific adenine glycosylase
MCIQEPLLAWYEKNRRDLPWRKTHDPYRILVSEVMLQQTQVERVIPKYEEWLRALPGFQSLAKAARSDVLRRWSGLGYNNRAVRLHALAKLLVEKHGGKLPDSEEELRKLPGIGPYTAGALMVFAHNKPGMCVDVNVERIIKRIFYTKTKINITKNDVKESFLVSFPAGRARDWGNTLMDFGSTVCTPTRPGCAECPIFAECKSKGERPDEKSLREKKRQTQFLDSNRWWRGRILRALTVAPSLDKRQLFSKIRTMSGNNDKEKFLAALKQLKDEGLVSGEEKLKIS